MGMYTELVLKCTVDESAPKEVKNIVKYLFGEDRDETPTQLPHHPFFECSRWTCIGSMSSHYHHPESTRSLVESCGDLHIFSRSDLKDYDDEIAKFIDWISPYLYNSVGECIGWSWYEENSVPTLIIKQEC